MLGDRGKSHPEWLGEFGDGCLAAHGEPGDYRPAGGVRERAKDSRKLVGWHR